MVLRHISFNQNIKYVCKMDTHKLVLIFLVLICVDIYFKKEYIIHVREFFNIII